MLRAVITAIAFIALPYTVDCGAHELSRYCKGTQVLTAREGVIIDHVPEAGSGIPMGRDWYLPNQRCFWSITPKGTAGAIRLSVNEYFRTESSFDYVDVYDRNPAEPNAALLAKFSGYYCSVTECVTPEYIVSYSGQMYISWVTDGQTENIGWSFSYATYDSAARVTSNAQGGFSQAGIVTATPTTPVPSFLPTVLNTCSGFAILTGQTGQVSDGPGNYFPNTMCSFLIDVPNSDMPVHLRFTQFDLESQWDWLKIYDGASASAPLIASMTDTYFTVGASSPPADVVATSGKMFLVFTTDDTTEKSGFTAEYFLSSTANMVTAAPQLGQTPAPLIPNTLYSACPGGVILARGGTISDGPKNYEDNTVCTWIILAPADHQIVLYFEEYQLETMYDYVRVYDGVDGTGAYQNLQGNLQLASVTGSSGSAHTSANATSSSNSMTVEFTSDASVNSNGFIARYYTRPKPSNALVAAPTPVAQAQPVEKCSGFKILTDVSGTISDGAGLYSSDATCEWRITSTSNGQQSETIRLTFTAFDLEQAWDSIKVYDGTDSNGQLLGTLTGSDLPAATNSRLGSTESDTPGVFTAISGAMFVRFTSDATVNKEGFVANYRVGNAVLLNEPTPAPVPLTRAPGLPSACDGVQLMDQCSFAIIYNPLESGVSDATRTCAWLINPKNAPVAPVQLTFSAFDTEVQYDWLQVWDGNGHTGKLLGRFSGNQLPPKLQAASGTVLIQYHSDQTNPSKGFHLEFASTGKECEGSLANLRRSEIANTPAQGSKVHEQSISLQVGLIIGACVCATLLIAVVAVHVYRTKLQPGKEMQPTPPASAPSRPMITLRSEAHTDSMVAV
jgi:hypothetical protein